MQLHRVVLAAALLLASPLPDLHAQPGAGQDDPLASWNEGPAKRAIEDFVIRVTREGGPDFVPAPERIAVFDNDGTLWGEQPMYFQLAFMLDRVRALAPDHPEWKDKEPFKSVLAGDTKTALADGPPAIAALTAATHSGMTTQEFETIVKDWISAARHPTSGRLYTDMIYPPMVELLDHLRAHGFKTYIVSGGGAEFMRPWVERVYGIPPEQVVGSRGKLELRMRGNEPVLVKQPGIDLLNDGPGKPVGIQQLIGRRPIAAFGNSDGDLQMLQWTTAGPGPRLAVIVHHTDSERETAYDRGSHIGKLDRALNEAAARGWTVVDMKSDWKIVFPFQSP